MVPNPSRVSRGWRIAVTDDDPRLVGGMVVTLRDAGHCVFAAYDGLAASELAIQMSDLDLLITNTRLGAGLDASELIRRVQSAKPWLAILHVGDPLPDSEGRLAKVATLREPFSPAQLLAAVAAVLGNAATADADGNVEAASRARGSG